MREIIDKLEKEKNLSDSEWKTILSSQLLNLNYLFERSCAVKEKVYGNKVFMRGLIEFTNFCKNDCFYCGIRRSNRNTLRYRLTEEQILQCCENGYALGCRTFVLQGGEDPHYTDDILTGIVYAIREKYSECAITLSTGERSRQSYKQLFEAGADRYLLRHETANEVHYRHLHPDGQFLEKRKQCLRYLKEIGYQVGCGFMVGSPGQTTQCLIDDLAFIRELQPQMVGIGPFIPHSDTPFAEHRSGSLEQTLVLLAIVRLMLPNVLLPATTALGTIHSKGREMGIKAGANVVMPNISPMEVRSKYLLYNNKNSIDDIAELQRQIKDIGCELAVDRGDPV